MNITASENTNKNGHEEESTFSFAETIAKTVMGNNLERMVISELSGLYQVFQHVECLVVL